VTQQLVTAAPKSINPSNVDLVLMEGCLHDVGFKTLLDPNTAVSDLSARTLSSCANAASLAFTAEKTYPRAKVFILSYPVLVSSQTDAALLNALATLSGVAAKDIEIITGATLAPLAGIPVDPLLTTVALIAGGVADASKAGNAMAEQQLASQHALAFYNLYMSVLDKKVQLERQLVLNQEVADKVAGKPAPPLGYMRLAIIGVPSDASNGYAAPNSYLWPVPTTSSHDDAFAQRQAACDAVAAMRGIIGLGECLEASAGFPNRYGAAAIVTALTPSLTGLLQAWKNAYGPK
jgi:hypothetical protein